MLENLMGILEVFMVEENSSLNIPLSEKLKSIPGIFGIRLGESPLYSVMLSEGDKEIRKYNPFILATITINGPFEKARKEAFLGLANYIFGKNKDNKHLKMTAPVLQGETSELIPMTSPFIQVPTGAGWSMSFILPMQYTLATAPTPQDKRIQLHKKPEHVVAALRYSGVNTEEKIRKYSAELTRWLSKKHLFNPIGEIQSAQYDGPSTIPFLRKMKFISKSALLNR